VFFPPQTQIDSGLVVLGRKPNIVISEIEVESGREIYKVEVATVITDRYTASFYIFVCPVCQRVIKTLSRSQVQALINNHMMKHRKH